MIMWFGLTTFEFFNIVRLPLLSTDLYFFMTYFSICSFGLFCGGLRNLHSTAISETQTETNDVVDLVLHILCTLYSFIIRVLD